MGALGLMAIAPLAVGGDAQERPKIQIPQPGVPQIMTLEGRYVRAAYNNEGYATSATSSSTCRSARSGCCSRSGWRSATACRTIR